MKESKGIINSLREQRSNSHCVEGVEQPASDRKLWTHVNTDLDATLGAWIVSRFVPGFRNATFKFVPANWDGAELGPHDLAIDISAGGKGVKGTHDADGTVHSCADTLFDQSVPAIVRDAIRPLVAFIDAQDSKGSAVGELLPNLYSLHRRTIIVTGINAVMRSWQRTVNGVDIDTMNKMFELYDAMLEHLMNHKRITVRFSLPVVAALWGMKKFAPEFTDMDVDALVNLATQMERDGDDKLITLTNLISMFASDEDAQALELLSEYVEAAHRSGEPIDAFAPDAPEEVRRIFRVAGLTGVLKAYWARFGNHPEAVLKRMFIIFDTMLEAGREHQVAQQKAKDVPLFCNGKVALNINNQYVSLSRALYSRGVKVIVYVDGNNLGLTRARGVNIRMDHPVFRAIVEAAGEKVIDGDWFAHPSGFLFCRGSRRSPSLTISKVDPMDLVQAACEIAEHL